MSAQLLALVESWIEAGAEPEATAWILLSMAVSSTALRDKIANNVIGERTLVDLVRTMYGQALARAAGDVYGQDATSCGGWEAVCPDGRVRHNPFHNKGDAESMAKLATQRRCRLWPEPSELETKQPPCPEGKHEVRLIAEMARAAGDVTPEEKTAMIAGLAELHEDDEDPDPTIH